MEILSDASFNGSITINAGKEFQNKDLLVFKHLCASCSSDSTHPVSVSLGFSDDVNSCVLEIKPESNTNSFCLAVHGDIELEYLLVNRGIYLSDGSISSWHELENRLSFAKAPKTFSSPSIPANCTAFEFTGTAISDSNKTHLIQVQNTSTGKSVIAETWMTTNKKPAMSFAGCTSTVAAGTYTAIVL